MRIEGPGATPVCRIRLEASWEDDGTADGEISQELFWVETLENPFDDEKRVPLSAADRGLIQLYYTPASRDAARQIKSTTGALAARLLRAIDWSPATKQAVEQAQTNVSASFDAEAAISSKNLSSTTRLFRTGKFTTLTSPQPSTSLGSRGRRQSKRLAG